LLVTSHYPDFGVTAWDIERRAMLVEHPGPLSWSAAEFSPDSRKLTVAHEDGTILIYDVSS
jgi:hypothetical protein